MSITSHEGGEQLFAPASAASPFFLGTTGISDLVTSKTSLSRLLSPAWNKWGISFPFHPSQEI